MESDRVIASIGKKSPQETGIKVSNGTSIPSLAVRKDFKQLLQEITGEMPQRMLELNVREFAGFQIALLNKVGLCDVYLVSADVACNVHFHGKVFFFLQDLKPQTFRNAYDISRSNLLDHLTRMRANLMKSSRRFFSGQDQGEMVRGVTVSEMPSSGITLPTYCFVLRRLPSLCRVKRLKIMLLGERYVNRLSSRRKNSTCHLKEVVSLKINVRPI